MRHRNPARGVEGLGERTAQDLTRELDTTFDDDAEQAIIDLQRRIDAAQAEMLVRVEDFEHREIARRSHGLTTVTWLRRFCNMSARKASATVKAARSLRHMDAIRERAVAGDIVYDNVLMLARARDRHPHAFSIHEPVFVEAATQLEPRKLKQAIDYWEQQVDHVEALRDTNARFRRRSVYLAQTLEGMWDLAGTLDPESGHAIDVALRSISDPDLIDMSDARSPAQRRADALTEVCRFWLDHNTTARTAGGQRPHITVTIDYETLTGSADTPLPTIDGTPVDPETVRRLACDAGIVRILVDSEGQPLDVGRRVRTAPPALRRALELRDGGCSWSGCDARPSWCDAHHVISWADGGATSLDNLRLLCRRHHRMIHQGETPPKGPEP